MAVPAGVAAATTILTAPLVAADLLVMTIVLMGACAAAYRFVRIPTPTTTVWSSTPLWDRFLST